MLLRFLLFVDVGRKRFEQGFVLIERQLQNIARFLNQFTSASLKLRLAPLVRRRLRLKNFNLGLLQQDLSAIGIGVAAVGVVGVFLSELIQERQRLRPALTSA